MSKHNKNTITKKQLNRKTKKAGKKTYKKKNGGGILDLLGLTKNPNQQNQQNQPTQPEKKSNGFFGFFNFKSDPQQAIQKLEDEKKKCVDDINAKIEKIRDTESKVEAPAPAPQPMQPPAQPMQPTVQEQRLGGKRKSNKNTKYAF